MADEFDLKPTSRGEEFLDVILRSLGGDTPDIPQPAWRYENTVERTYQDSNEYSVFYYTRAKVGDNVLTDEVKLVTDSENGYLTFAE